MKQPHRAMLLFALLVGSIALSSGRALKESDGFDSYEEFVEWCKAHPEAACGERTRLCGFLACMTRSWRHQVHNQEAIAGRVSGA